MEQTRVAMDESGFRLAAIEVGQATTKLYSRCAVRNDSSYYHGEFSDEAEMLLSLELRCQQLDIQFVYEYARWLLSDYTFSAVGTRP